MAAEEAGIDGAYFRVHHFAEQQASPFPLLPAIAARTSRIEIGTGVIDMRYENPLYMAEEAAAVDLISAGRLQLGVSRGSPESVVAGYEAFGHLPAEGESAADMARRHTALFRSAISGAVIAAADPQASGPHRTCPGPAAVPFAPRANLLGCRQSCQRPVGRARGHEPHVFDLADRGYRVPFDQLQAEQIAGYREAWAAAGHRRTARVSVSRSIVPLIDDDSRRYFGLRAQAEARDQVGYIDGGLARFGRRYIGEPERLVEELSRDAAVAAADTLLVTVPNQLGVDFNVRLLGSISRDLRPALGWD
ncbi:alkanesulfonate monooxygenase SsuD/methylene tetrahydromethanopterin reductase-like flavin-dependent oxidoreductase (luciferase family) [Arthrobacter sp. V4I6]|uniref:LLM class flavin-dependent oxidoreductase n=1 Tax=unclassified Arthrobacter TaxID=235627 RepID=UPI002781F419|nr:MULTISPECIES: LLM class flavin-dependent oxidoreductase [unclassified Arthrobacter]MDQ0820817.1 alkanesulfonate monooxygenase SsuD/methylene tetrahydromethanopterin reductase-like flavin-dependent oxidoreductase (luciferase family) [Arthrobacter sp. V1I7]MDQ0855079.1 alkanesulfonate monooxygenase SsuD/methylene tetrahydromethanopterin reductase-like flavin-dependent oxidoreductase (luciferase family) [Arthrobacter sp. V4I6]